MEQIHILRILLAGGEWQSMSLKPPKKVIWVKVGRNHGGIRIS